MSDEVTEAIVEKCMLQYEPTDFQRKIKIRLWAALQNSMCTNPKDLTNAEIANLCNSSTVKRWLADPLFREWLLDARGDEFTNKVEYLCEKSLCELERILTSNKSSDKDKINAVKLILETSGRLHAHKAKQEFLDKTIGRMDERQLQDYLSKHGVQVDGIQKLDAIDGEILNNE